MIKLGKVIRELRQAKNMTLAELSEGIVSATFLSKFERGQNDISASKLFKLIQRLNISLFEFNSMMLTLNRHSHGVFVRAYANAIKHNDIAQLNSLLSVENKAYQETGNIRHYHNMILITQRINKFSDLSFDNVATNEIINYLLNVEDWHYYEITVYNNALFFLPIDTIVSISKKILNKIYRSAEYNRYRKDIIIILTNVIEFMLEANYLNDAQKMLTEVKKFCADSTFYYEITRLKFYKGLLHYKSKQKKLGLKLINEAIETMQTMGNFTNARAHQKHLEDFLQAEAKCENLS